MKRTTKILIVLLALFTVSFDINAWRLERKAHQMETVRMQYGTALNEYYRAISLIRADRLEESRAVLATLHNGIEKHKNDEQWARLVPFIQQADALAAYGVSIGQWREFVAVRAASSHEAPPDPKAILEGYRTLQETYTSLAGVVTPFDDPKTTWWLLNDAGVAAFWNLIGRWAMLGAKYEELKPIFDASYALFKRAKPYAERTSQEASNIVSQNLDFMSRLDEALEQEQQKQQQPPQDQQGEGQDGQGAVPQRKGLGDFLSRLKAPGRNQGSQGLGIMLDGQKPDIGKDFLPLPNKGIGTSRLPTPGTR